MTDPTPQLPGWQSVQDGLWTDGRRVASYRTPPNLPAAPPFVAPAGWEVLAPPVLSPASTRWVAQLRADIPAVRPPLLPFVTHKIADPSKEARGNGVDLVGHVAPQTITDVHYDGFEQNIRAEGNQGGITLRNVRSTRAYRATPQDTFVGQGLYLSGGQSPSLISGCLFRDNGWQQGRPAKERSAFRHGIYAQFDAPPPTIEDCIFAGNSGCGVQLRNGGTIRRCVFLDNSIAVLAVMGNVSLEDCVIYGGHYTAALDPTNGYAVRAWEGNTALMAYWPVVAVNVAVVGRKGQGDSPDGLPVYPGGAVNLSTKYGKAEWHPHPAGPSVIATNCTIAGWPGEAFTGDGLAKGPDGKPLSVPGFAVTPGAGFEYDYSPALAAVEASTLSVPAAREKLASDIRGLLPH